VELLLVSMREEISSHYGLGLPAMKLSSAEKKVGFQNHSNQVQFGHLMHHSI
jgi:hypothetical protein